MRRLHLIIVDGNELTRALLKYVLQASSSIQITGEAADYKSAVALFGSGIPDALVLGDDLGKEEKVALISAVQSDYPGVRIIELSDLEKAFQRRANVLPKDSWDQTVLTAMVTGSSSDSVH